MKRKLILIFFSLLLFVGLAAQCNDPSPPGTSCGGASIFCKGEIDGYCSTLPNGGVDGPPFLCFGIGAINNVQWIAFAAGSEDLSLLITPSNCDPAVQIGLQAGVYDDCSFSNVIACVPLCQALPFSLDMNDLIIGHIYYLIVDGCAGNICDYSIDVTNGSTALPAPVPVSAITGNSTVCAALSDVLYLIPPVENSNNYTWTLPPGATYISNNNLGNEILVDFGSSPGQICVNATSDCYPNISNSTCVLVSMIPISVENIEVAICAGESFSVCGVPYGIESVYQIDCSPNFHGCDSTINLSLFVMEPMAVVVPPGKLGCEINASIMLDGLSSTADSFLWETIDGVICDDPTNLFLEVCSPGMYCLTATSTHVFSDGSGEFSCTDEVCVTVTQNEDSPNTTVSSNDVNCFGETNGSASITVNNTSIGPFVYNWNPNVSTSNSASNLSAGTYTVTVTSGSNGCTVVEDITIDAPPIISIILTQQNIVCNGDNSGSATVTPIGGTAPYSFLWCNGQTTEAATGLPTGNCEIIVTDVNNCTTRTEIIITQPDALSATIFPTYTNCSGNNTGTAAVTAIGGTAPYSYLWCNGQTTEEVTNLAAGTCSLTITDAGACILIDSVTIPEGVILSTEEMDTRCYNATDGWIDLTLTSGLPPFTFLWSTGATTEDITDLSAGAYSVTVTDVGGCTLSSPDILIAEPNELFAEAVLESEISCKNSIDGRIRLTVSGGTARFSYNWDNAPDIQNPTGLGVGNYNVTITDFNGCTITESINLIAPDALTLSAEPSPATCSNSPDGGIDLTIDGGTLPYSYDWSNGSINEDATGLTTGIYEVIVTDDHDCTATISEEIGALEGILLSIIDLSEFNGFNVSCPGASDGSATVFPESGVAPFSYNWSNGAIEATVNNLIAGRYSVTVTDANGCTGKAQVTLEEPVEIVVSTVLQDVTCFGGEDGAIFIDNILGGISPFTFSLDGEDFSQFTLFVNLSAGSYELTVQDAAGCEAVSNMNITSPGELQVGINVIGGDEQIQLGDSIQIMAQVNLDTSSLRQFGWTKGLFWMEPSCENCFSRWIFPLETTLYEYQVIDEQGCIGSDELLVTIRKDRPVYIPNVYSPNGDGVNDYFQIYLGEGVQQVNTFKVYDNCGELVYERSDFYRLAPEEGWDGTFRGKLMNPAVFVYWAEVEFTDGRVELYKGNVTLLR